MQKIGPLTSPDILYGHSLRGTVIAQMQRILAHTMFLKSPRLSQLFSFLVEMSIAGQAHLLKEYTIAVDVFKRSETFDCRLDSIVRVEVARLRKKLALFYSTVGSEDKIVLALPSSGYEPLLYIWDDLHFSAPIIALVGDQDGRAKVLAKGLYERRMKVVHLSKDSVGSFQGLADLIVVFLGTAEERSSVRWVLEAPCRTTGAILFVPQGQSEECSRALQGVVKALIGETESTVSLGCLYSLERPPDVDQLLS